MKYINILLLLFILLSTVSLHSQEFMIDKVKDIYKSEIFEQIIKNDNYIIAAGRRAVHLYSIDNNGNLIQLDELPLWGELTISTNTSIEKINNNIYIFGVNPDNSATRLYKIRIENESLILEDSIDYIDIYSINQIKAINNHLFVITYYQPSILYIYENESFEIVAEYNVEEYFHDNEFYKLTGDCFFTWENQPYDQMHIYDASDISNIQEIVQIDFNSSFPNIPVSNITMLNDSTLCICHPDQYSFFDISDIYNWQLIGLIEFAEDSALGSLAILNENRIVIPFDDLSVGLYDISDISQPEMLSFMEYNRLYDEESCVCFNNSFYHVDHGFGIHQFNIVNDQFEYLGPFPEFSASRYTYMYEDILAVRTYYWRGMHFYDMSDINNIQYICTHFENHFQNGCDFQDDLMAVSLISFPDYNENVDVYNITNIENPILINRIENTYATAVYLDLPYLYTRESLSSSNESHFVKYDISQPFNPQVIYDFELYPHMFGFFKRGEYVYYRGGNETINVLGNLDGNYPEIVSTIEIDELDGFWQMTNDYLQVIKPSEYKFSLYSLENPLSPEFMFDWSLNLNQYSGGIADNLFFLGNCNVEVFDIENGFSINDPLYNLELPFYSTIRNFFERDGIKYVLFHSNTGVSLYDYEYNVTFSFDEIISSNEVGLSNYPNPFNPETTISFNLPESDKVKLEIYNMLGQKVKQLVNDDLAEGQHSITWNGIDESDKAVSSGVYLYKLKVDGKEKALKKCLLLK